MFADNFSNIAAERVFKAGSIFIGLSSTKPTGTGSNVTEPTGSTYARQLVVLGSPSGGVMTNTDRIEFQTGSSDWGSIPYYVLYDAKSGGNFIGWGDITNAPTMVANFSLLFETGELKFAVSDISG